jgi:hypothetical protein
VLAPAGTPTASEHPQELVPATKPKAWPRPSGAGQHRELMAQEQILKREVVAWARPGQDRRGQKPEEFEHVFSIADLRSPEVVPPHNPSATARRCSHLARSRIAPHEHCDVRCRSSDGVDYRQVSQTHDQASKNSSLPQTNPAC